jgi:hypothetical protein
MKSRKINFSDISELFDKQLSSMPRVGRPNVATSPLRVLLGS